MIFVYDVHYSRHERLVVPCTLSTIFTLGAMRPPAVLKGNNAATASQESRTVMSAVMPTAGHAEEAVVAVGPADRLVEHAVVTSLKRVLHDRSSNNCWHGAGCSTIATEALPRMVDAPLEVSIVPCIPWYMPTRVHGVTHRVGLCSV